MTVTALDKARRQLRKRPVHLTVKIMVDPDTGDRRRCLVATDPIDMRSMAERGFNVGAEVKADNLRHARNPQFFRLAHRLGGFLADHTDLFHGLTQHDALKSLQLKSGIGVLEEEFTLPDLGVCHRRVADSLNFDDMDEGRFRELWDGGPAAGGNGGWLGWLRANVWPGLDRGVIDSAEQLVARRE